ncbi:MAG: hypothetical protein VXZ37_04030 [Verrucomicrobiota bacterium]|nr:hypothetical protein [Verrucomicrobiota bacterium]
MSQKRSKLQSREERTHNLVPIQPHDLTSQAYHRESPRGEEPGIGMYLTLAIWVFLIVFIFSILDLVVGSWQQIK